MAKGRLRHIQVEPTNNGATVTAHHEPDADDQKRLMVDHSSMTDPSSFEGDGAAERAGTHVANLINAHHKAGKKPAPKGHPAMQMAGRPQAPTSAWKGNY